MLQSRVNSLNGWVAGWLGKIRVFPSHPSIKLKLKLKIKIELCNNRNLAQNILCQIVDTKLFIKM